CGMCSGGNTGYVANSDKDCTGECFGEASIDDCGICSGFGTDHEANSDQDCFGICPDQTGFGAELDDCGICSGGLTGYEANSDLDDCGICFGDNLDKDCNGNCFGSAELDDCDICSGGLSGHVANSDIDCNGDCFGVADLDDCGVCSGGLSDHDANSDVDCYGDCFGSAELDDCGICSGGNTDHEGNSDIDCYGDCFGEAYFDDCGTCSGGNAGNEANSEKDCTGECFGEAYFDDCGTCSGGTSGHVANSEKDCNGDCFGLAFLDSCDVCSGGNSGHEEDSDIDCNGDCFGEAYIDDCGLCDDDITNDNQCEGCTDSEAQNYDEEAILDDGSCIFGPTILSIYDVPEDQGGYVFVNWEAITLDAAPNEEILKYSVWRYIPNQRGWEFLDYVDAYYFEEYSYVAPTINISFGDNIEHTDYKVLAHTANQWEYYESPVVSGFSIDNLAPDSVQEFTVLVEENHNLLSWIQGEIDIDYYNIYRNGQLISQVSDTYYIDEDIEYGQSVIYEIDAVDIHQNQGQSISSEVIYSAIAGDLNLDQNLNIYDIIIMVNLALDELALSDFYIWSGDLNYDGGVNIFDIIILLDLVLSDDISAIRKLYNKIN
ncbi:hypothetical protein OAI93_00510, partial [bacterium]|nr:hypothetical protein [bacterium]